MSFAIKNFNVYFSYPPLRLNKGYKIILYSLWLIVMCKNKINLNIIYDL